MLSFYTYKASYFVSEDVCSLVYTYIRFPQVAIKLRSELIIHPSRIEMISEKCNKYAVHLFKNGNKRVVLGFECGCFEPLSMTSGM